MNGEFALQCVTQAALQELQAALQLFEHLWHARFQVAGWSGSTAKLRHEPPSQRGFSGARVSRVGHPRAADASQTPEHHGLHDHRRSHHTSELGTSECSGRGPVHGASRPPTAPNACRSRAHVSCPGRRSYPARSSVAERPESRAPAALEARTETSDPLASRSRPCTQRTAPAGPPQWPLHPGQLRPREYLSRPARRPTSNGRSRSTCERRVRLSPAWRCSDVVFRGCPATHDCAKDSTKRRCASHAN